MPFPPSYYADGKSASVMYTSTNGGKVDPEFEEMQRHSMDLYSHAFLGSCSGGFSPASKELDKDDGYYKAVCISMEGSPMQDFFCSGAGMDKHILKPTAW